MKKFLALMAIAVFLPFMGYSDDTDSQDVSITFSTINDLEVSSGTVGILVATSSQGLATGTDASTLLYAYSNDAFVKKITASIDTDMATGDTLSLLVASYGTGTPVNTSLSTAVAEIMTGIAASSATTGSTLTYTFTTTNAQSSAINRTVVLTLVGST
ncbi:MAG: hypothetical protein S4CHLAM37_00980 [Chlamydiia bacterium]|nr:hypothetical protein [Chlamydiia bacterium]